MEQSGQTSYSSSQRVDPTVLNTSDVNQAGMKSGMAGTNQSGMSNDMPTSNQSGMGHTTTGSNQAGQMSAMTEQVIAADLLMSAKSAIKNYAIAISECATPELRQALTEQLNDTIRSHEQITNYMINKGYYHPVDVLEQLRLDQQAAQTALNLQ